MPAPDPPVERRDGRLLNVLFWTGVGLAPLAALLLLIGQEGGPLRVALVLALLAVILIGLSITLRRGSKAARLDFEDQLFDEIEALRRDVREDIATAARATHRAFGEKLQVLYQSVEALRGQLDAVRAEAGRTGYDRPSPGAGAGSAAGTSSTGSYQQMPRSAMPPPASAPGQSSGGRVRHTETVQVTTRQTIVDPLSGDPGRGTVYGAGQQGYGQASYGTGSYPTRAAETPSAEWSIPSQRGRRSAEPDESSWRDPRAYEPQTGTNYGGREEATGDGRYSELRMGERRAAMRSDDTGTEMRIEDRWAAVRREEARREEAQRAGDRWGEQRSAWEEQRSAWDERQRWNDGGDGRGGGEPWRGDDRTGAGRWQPDDTGSWRTGEVTSWGGGEATPWNEARWDRALPPGGIEVTGPWTQDWIESEREPVRERRDRRRDEGYGGRR